MRAVIQRVKNASVEVENEIISEIGNGLLVLLGVEDSDNQSDIDWLCNKIANLRIFDDGDGIMNISTLDSKAEILVVSQFTLFASTKKGNRPSYIRASKPEIATPLYQKFCDDLGKILNIRVKTGKFGAHMEVNLTNDGPVTLIIDTKSKE